jgi:hypothetical protein
MSMPYGTHLHENTQKMYKIWINRRESLKVMVFD